MQKTEQQYLRPNDCARYLGIHRSTFYRLVGQGDIPEGKQITARIRLWEKKVLDDFVAKKKTPLTRKTIRVLIQVLTGPFRLPPRGI